MHSFINGLRQAVMLLTVLPFPACNERSGREDSDHRCSSDSPRTGLSDSPRTGLAYFPLVGVLIGLLVLLGARIAHIPGLLGAVIAVFIWEGTSGFLHLDGVADTADALLSRRKGSEALSIMRDSRVGAMGVSLTIFAILLKVAAAQNMLSGTSSLPSVTIVLAPVVARFAVVLVMTLFPYADAKRGLGATVAGGALKWQLICSFGLTVAAGGSVLWFAATASPLSAVSLLVVLISAISAGIGSALILGYRSKKTLGGITGDVCGASIELAEISFLIVSEWVGGMLV